MKTKKNTRKTRKLRKTLKNKNKISINIDFTSKDRGYKDLMNPRLTNFLFENIVKGNNLIQTQKNKPFFVNKKNTMRLQAIPVEKWNLYPQWDNILCKKYNDFITPLNI